jgi:hypothetical protein
MSDNNTQEPTESTDLMMFDDGFETTEVVDEGFEKLPEGKYQVLVDRAELARSRAGHHMLKWSFKILGPTHQGRLLWKNSMIMDGPSLGFLKRDLQRSGLKLQKVSDLPNRLDELVDIVLQVTVKDRQDGNGDQFQNVFIDKRLNVEGGESGEGAKTETSLSKF